MKFAGTFAAQPRWVIVVEMLLLMMVIGWLDHLSGWELSLFIAYAAPILLVVWFVGRTYGIVFAILGALVWSAANQTEQPYESVFGYGTAVMSRFAYFLFLAIGGAALKAHRDTDSERIVSLERERQLEQEILRVSEREQQRMGRDLHDGLCQVLATGQLSAKMLTDTLAGKGIDGVKEAASLANIFQEAIRQARGIARGIFPTAMDGSGLSIALDGLAAATRQVSKVEVHFEETGDTRMADPDVGMQMFRIAQEAVSNALKHSGADRIVISLHREDASMRLVISDDGKGLASTGLSDSGLGLGTMKYRAHSIGAEFEIAPGPQRGVLVVCKVPLSVSR